mmetsp:Transcript_16603/g.28704  ORF Transcript_16603/g.28704 Transcript_16603/m.28704 type:complete len:113 (+) Transcript_16603:162-500(+)
MAEANPPRTEMPMGLYHPAGFECQLSFFGTDPCNAVFEDEKGTKFFGTYCIEGPSVKVRWTRKTYTKLGRTTREISEEIVLAEEMSIEEGGYAALFRGKLYKHQRLTGWKDD